MMSCYCKKNAFESKVNDSISAKDPKIGIKGMWVNKDYLDELNYKKSHVRSKFIPDLFQIDVTDTLATIFDGVNTVKSKYTLEKDTFHLEDYGNDTDFLHSFITYFYNVDSNGVAKLMTNVNKKTTSFFKVKPGENIVTMINRNVLGGKFKSGASNDIIQFNENGTISGWPLFNKFEICFSGDCLLNSEGGYDVLYLTGPTNSGVYGFKYLKNGTQELQIIDIKNKLGKGDNSVVATFLRQN